MDLSLTLNKYIDVSRELFSAFSLSSFPFWRRSPALNGKTSLSVRPQRGKNAIGIAQEGGSKVADIPTLEAKHWGLSWMAILDNLSYAWRFSHRKWGKTNHQQSRASSRYHLSCCLVSPHFLWCILWLKGVCSVTKMNKGQGWLSWERRDLHSKWVG